MIVSYFTTFPVHQPAGLVTEATEETLPSSVWSGSVIVAASPGFDAVDDRFVNTDLHLHLGQVGHEQQDSDPCAPSHLL